jgi:ABC-type sulfate/molybdate transport systems ATPase subunit
MVLDLLELDTVLADSRPAQLSAGERQRVALARAIVGFGLGGPEAAVLLDEPLSAVEVGTRIRLLQAVLADVGRHPIPVVLVSHDPDEIAAVAGRRTALVEGRLTAA